MSCFLIVRFESYEQAQAARQAVLDHVSIAPAEVRLELRDDESGPTEGNFISGNKRHDGEQSGRYDENFIAPKIDGAVMISVSCADQTALGSARELLLRLGGTDIETLTRGAA